MVKKKPWFICKEKGDKDAKATTLIVHMPIIGRFSERWDHNFYPLNQPRWSQVIPLDGSSNLKKIILLASNHKNIAKSKPYNTLGWEVNERCANWDSSFSVNGGFSYIPLYWEWLEDILGWCKCLLDVTHLYSVVFASLFTYNYDEKLMKAFCKCWSLATNTIHTSVWEISITPWDLSILGGIPCTSVFYDEVVPNVQELDDPICPIVVATFSWHIITFKTGWRDKGKWAFVTRLLFGIEDMVDTRLLEDKRDE